jgi:chromate transporter
MAGADHGVSFEEATRTWAYVAIHSFGGPAGQIAVMHRVVVEERKWIGEERFLHALNFCMLLPGPEAHQLVTYLGWLLHGTAGALVAGGLFVLPGFLTILALSMVYVTMAHAPAVAGLLFGLKAAVAAVVVEAVLRIGRRALRNRVLLALAAASFVATAAFHVPFPAIVASAAAIGFAGDRLRPGLFRPPEPVAGAPAATDAIQGPPPSVRRTAAVFLGGLVVWLGPIAVLAVVLGPDHVLVRLGTFFSQTAVVTFGGAYAVLAYVAQHAVAAGWLRPAEMLDGLGLAETTPGPLIMVVEFVGFLAAWRDPGTLPPLAMATLGAVVTTWATFAPSFLWILAGAPWVEWLRARPSLGSALAAITAAVVGVILDLAL